MHSKPSWKSSKLPWTLSLVVALATAILTGCSSGGPLVRREAPAAVVTTIPAVTNTATVGTNTVVTIIPPSVVTNWVTNVTYEVNSQVEGVVQTARTLSAFAPAPVGTIVDAVLGVGLFALGAIARIKSKKAKLVDVVIQGVESANDPTVKQKIQELASAVGLESSLNAEVRRMTK